MMPSPTRERKDTPELQQQDIMEDVQLEDTYSPPTNSLRFSKWVALAVFSLIAWLATVGGRERHQMDAAEKWALAATTLSMVFGTIGAICCIYGRGLFVGQTPEIGLAVFLLAIWAAGLPVIMNPSNSIAVGYTDYFNANLYFSTWGATLAIGWICGDLVKEQFGMDLVELMSPLASARRGKWYALVATSLVVMGSSTRVYKAFSCSSDVMAQSSTCRQTKFAIAAGVVGTVLSMMVTLVLFLRLEWNRTTDGVCAVVMVIVWSFGLGYITFGQGPGQNIGNLYFATWASFVLSVLLLAESYRERVAAQELAQRDEENGQDQDPSMR